jgi:probable HAF family extracellular repeat protein
MYWTSSSNSAQPLTGLGGTIGNAGIGISDSGVVVGQAYSPATSSMRAVIWSTVSSAPVNLGTLGGTSSAANNINASGTIVGEADTSGNTQRHAIQWISNGAGGFSSTDLGLLGGTGTQSSAFGINASGKIVGFSEIAFEDEHAFIFDGGVMYDLNSFVTGASGWTLRGADSINDAGQIVGYASNNVTNAEHAFLLTPTAIPEPATYAGLVGLVAFAVTALRRRQPLN